jgi:hypothetical protein
MTAAGCAPGPIELRRRARRMPGAKSYRNRVKKVTFHVQGPAFPRLESGKNKTIIRKSPPCDKLGWRILCLLEPIITRIPAFPST